MSAERFLSSAHVGRLAETLAAGGTRVFGPVTTDGRTEYRAIGRPGELDLHARLTALPLKALFLPPTEVLFTWTQQHNDVSLAPVPTTFAPAVVLGARPCDAAGLEILDRVMNWDYRDELWFGRREATTIVTLACSSPDADCFCESVGLSPDATKGSDVLLRETPGGYLAVALTDKGRALVERGGALFEDVPAGRIAGPAVGADSGDSVGRGFSRAVDHARLQSWLASHFDDPVWAGIGLRCHGCGACASACPTCHCFDIVDEPDGLRSGTRRRNWDACQTSKFTVHASGHNPRGDQTARFRQRVLHKFQIYPQRFGDVLCTGCGRCARVCAAGQNLPDILAEIGRAALAGADAETRS